MKKANLPPAFTALLAAAVVILGGLAGLLAYLISLYTAELESYESLVSKLHRLQNSSPYPSTQNLSTLKSQTEELKQALLRLSSKLAERQPPLPETTPNQFQDELRRQVTAVSDEAKKAGVELPSEFYLGFNEFRDTLPTPAAAPHLARQLISLRAIADILIRAGVSRIDLWQRQPLPIERDPESAQWPAEPGPQDLMRSSTFLLAFSGDQHRVRKAFNELLSAPQFFLIRSLEILNSSRQAPSKSAGMTPPSPPVASSLTDLFGGPSQSPPQREAELPIILGKESVTIKMRVDFIDFAPLAHLASEPAPQRR